MSLRGTCTICTDYFDADNDISVTHCGHLFHGTCLNQWIKTCGAQRTCPQCRTRITAKQIVDKIFINIPEEDETKLDPFRLKNKLDEAESKLKKYKYDKNEYKSALKAMEESKDELLDKIKKLKSDIKSERNAIHLLKADMETMKNEVDEARISKQEMKRLREQVKLSEKVRLVLQGQKGDVDEMLSQYTSGSSTHETKQLATFCVAMKQEYETIKQSRSKLNNELMKLKRDLHRKEELLINKASAIETLELSNGNLHKSEDALNEENSSLRRKLTALQQAIASPSDTRSSAIHRLITESPAPQFLTPVSGLSHGKRGPVTGGPIKMKKPRLSTSFDGEDIDLDDNGNRDAVKHEKPADENDLSCHVMESPTTSKMRKHCKEMGINFVKTSSSKNNQQNPANGQFSNPSTIRSKLLASKNSSAIPIGYDGFGGHKKLLPSSSKFVNSSGSMKFSSANANKFKVPSTNTATSKNRFDRLKRIGPR